LLYDEALIKWLRFQFLMELFFRGVDPPQLFVPLSESVSQPSLGGGAEQNDNGCIAEYPVGLFQGPADDTPTSCEVLSDYTPSPTAPQVL
jgi:hypothetical protein